MKIGQDELHRIRELSESSNNEFSFLGYAVNLDSGEIHETLNKSASISRVEFGILQALLAHYCRVGTIGRKGKLVKFADLPGGHAYERAFLQRAVEPLARAFGDVPGKMVECAKLLKGFELPYGDCSVEIPSLPRVVVVIILWHASEFPASATMLYDESASNYLPTEDLAVLGELTTMRMLNALDKV